MSTKQLVRERIAKRAAAEIKDGMIVNLGIGIPTLVANYIPEGVNVTFHAENGILGTSASPAPGEEDPYLCDAGGNPITVVEGASYFDSATAFGIIRRGYLDITILGALEVSEQGDLANWIVPGKRVPGMGGAMELAQKAQKVIVVTSHTNRSGGAKLLQSCTLPLTAKACVDMVITEMAVIEVAADGFVLREVMPSYTIQDVLDYTEARVIVPSDVVINT